MTTGKTIALTRWTFFGKVMSLLFNMLSRLVITFLPRSKRLLISWLQSPSAVILEPPKIKSATVSPSICHEVMGPDAMILVFWPYHVLHYLREWSPLILRARFFCVCLFVFLNWSIVPLYYWIGFCCTTKWISYMYTYSSLLDLPQPYPIPPI